MSRELRKVPLDWEHPKTNGKYTALHEYNNDHKCDCEYCTVNESDSYMPKIGDNFGYALYETVSEGTPITPVFKTKDELADYLIRNGDFWGEKWSEKSAKSMMEKGYAPSGFMMRGVIYKPNNMGDIPDNNGTV